MSTSAKVKRKSKKKERKGTSIKIDDNELKWSYVLNDIDEVLNNLNKLNMTLAELVIKETDLFKNKNELIVMITGSSKILNDTVDFLKSKLEIINNIVAEHGNIIGEDDLDMVNEYLKHRFDCSEYEERYIKLYSAIVSELSSQCIKVGRVTNEEDKEIQTLNKDINGDA